ncbi:MAG TPA: chloride channel protein [Thermoanaerobaculia bacterium]|jgi:CIC family chloride channel protein|nr:chloride channel protein [Thermoanaerobaculia bacterium]
MEVRSAAWLRRVREWVRPLDFTLARRFGLATREDRYFFFVIVLVGLVAGVLGLATDLLIGGVQRVLWGRSGELLAIAREVPPWRVVAALAAGGVVVGLIIWLGKQSVGGEGMGSLIEAVALSGGRIRPRPVIVEAVAAVVTVGSGGSLGREGPMIRLGGMIASWTGLRLRLPPHRVKILVGCGAAAGLAATYNVPIGGALFAMEVILGNFALEIFGPIVVSSVIATLIARALSGNVPLYAAPSFELQSPWEMLLYAGLGIVGALASVAFMLGIRAGSGLFKHLPAPLRPVIAFALVGAIGVYVPYALGRGYETINLALASKLKMPEQIALPGDFTVLLLLGLALAKLVTTSLTRGGGGAGGMFTPSLLFGSLIGGAYGWWVHLLWPHVASPYGAYAAVGMAAIMAGTSHAPISAILILFEFTGNYNLILPLMVASILASLVSRRLHPPSIYTEGLTHKGVELPWRMEEAVLASLKAESLLEEDPETLRPEDPYRKVVDRFLSTSRQRLFVVGVDGKLKGAISLHDIKHSLDNPDVLTAVVAHDLMLPVDRVIRSDERLHRATEYFARSEFERLPVVDADGRFVGVIGKRDVLAVYAQEVLGRPALLATFVSGRGDQRSREYVHLPPDFSVRLVPVPPQLVGKSLTEARLPQTLGARVLEIRRRNQTVIPLGDTVFQEGDQVILVGPTVAMEALSEGRLDVLQPAV